MGDVIERRSARVLLTARPAPWAWQAVFAAALAMALLLLAAGGAFTTLGHGSDSLP